MTPFLVALVAILVLLLYIQHRRVKARLARLTNALRSHDRSSLGEESFHRAPAAFRELERQIFEQLFEAENLERRIGRRDDLLATVVEGLGDAVLVFDKNLRVRFTNPSASELFGWDTPPVGERARQCISDYDLVKLIESSVEYGRRETAEIKLSVSSESGDSPRILEVDIAPLQKTEAGSVDRARAILHDVTEARQLEQVRKDFVANASHELRTPLTIINGYLENLVDTEIEDQKMALRFVQVMQKHGDRLARIIEDMLTISKLESHSETLQRESFDLKGCAEDVVARLAPVIEQKGTKIKLKFPDDSYISGDPFYWDQILFNLVENALKENDAGRLKVGVRMERLEEWDEITIWDNGVGIPQAVLAFIFKRFYRVDANRSAEKKGTGLGLSIVKRAVEAHGGTISVRSTPGIETAFTIRIPRQEDADVSSV